MGGRGRPCGRPCEAVQGRERLNWEAVGSDSHIEQS